MLQNGFLVTLLAVYAMIIYMKGHFILKILESTSTTLEQELQQAYTEYVRAFDKWVLLAVQKRHSDRHVIDSIKSDVDRNLKSNSSYYGSMAKESESQHDQVNANRYRLIQKVYEEIKK